MNPTRPEAGDLVRRFWVTREQKQRWAQIYNNEIDPDSLGIVIGPSQIERPHPTYCYEDWVSVLWADQTRPIDCLTNRLIVVSKGIKRETVE